MRYLIKILLLNFFIFLNLFSQSIQWSDITSQYNLPQGIKLYKGERSSPALKCWYLDVDLNNKDLAIRPYMLKGDKLGVPTFTNRVGAYAGINAGYFDLNSTTVLSTVVYPEEVLAQNPQYLVRSGVNYPATRSAFTIKSNKSFSIDWIWHFSSQLSDLYTFLNPTNNAPGSPATAPTKASGKALDSVHFTFGGGPVLIKNGVSRITYNEEVFFGSGVELNVAQPRTAIGYKSNNHIILFVADGRQTASNGLTLTELKDILLGLGCYEAMNLDGGGSSQMAIGNQLVNLPEGGTYTRPVPVIVAVVKSDSAYFPKPILYSKVIDNGDPECQFIGSWIASSNAGYYGNTPAMLATIGSGDKQAIYSFSLPKKAVYTIQAWWVNAFNRSNATPIIIKHQDGIDTVRVDQTLNGSKWNTLKSFTFDSNKVYSVTISNNTTNGTYVCADAIRIISYDTVFIPTEVSDVNSKVFNFSLHQNYPNPFNPITNITFEIPAKEFIELKIYDALGREVEVLVKSYLDAGKYNYSWNATNFNSGIYFYELKTSSERYCKKMILLK